MKSIAGSGNTGSRLSLSIILLASGLFLSSFTVLAADSQKEKDKARCAQLLEQLDAELEAVQADVLADAAPISHATTLLAGASLRYQFGRYKSCIEKATRGRAKLKPYLKGPVTPKKDNGAVESD